MRFLEGSWLRTLPRPESTLPRRSTVLQRALLGVDPVEDVCERRTGRTKDGVDGLATGEEREEASAAPDERTVDSGGLEVEWSIQGELQMGLPASSGSNRAGPSSRKRPVR